MDKLDEHLWANLKVVLKNILSTGKFRGEELDDYPTRTRVTRQSLMDEHLTVEDGGVCSPGMVKGLKQVINYNTKLVESLRERYKAEFDNPFYEDIKDVLDLNFMLELENKLEENDETYQGCLEIVEKHGVKALTEFWTGSIAMPYPVKKKRMK